MLSAPLQPGQRIPFADVLRGFAITGVLFAYLFWNLGTEPGNTWTSFDKMLNEAGYFLVDSKFYSTLACLFGVGFVMHMNRTKDIGKGLLTYRKRLLILLLIGAIHALLLRSGDVLVPYAILGLVVTCFYSASNNTIIVAMVITFLLGVFAPLAWRWMGFSFPQRPSATGEPYFVEQFARVKYLYSIAIFYWETTLFLLLTGLLLGKIFTQSKVGLSNYQFGIIIVSGLVTGTISYLVINIYSAQLQSIPDIGNTFIVRSTVYHLLNLLHKFGIAAAYAAILFLFSRSFRLTSLANLGRMSLTNYISQSLVLVPICVSFDLFGHFTPTISFIFFVVFWVVQVLFSRWWLKNHKFGPLEWLVRRFAYGESTVQKKASGRGGLVAETVLVKK